jgi:nucleotide-binding universal stress UspA family protein
VGLGWAAKPESVNATLTVGYDGSPAAQRAIRWAAVEAARRLATVKVVSCYSVPIVVGPWIPSVPVDEDGIREEVTADLGRTMKAVAADHPHVRFEKVVVRGAPRDQLVAQAEGSDLLVVGSSGAGEVESWLLGSVAHAVCRTSPCPVVIVPSQGAMPVAGRLVVGYDGSPAAGAAIDWAVDEADRRDAELLVLHVWRYPYSDDSDGDEARDFTRVDAGLVLDGGVERAQARSRGPVKGELVEAPPADGLLGAASEADLVVLGSRGHGGIYSSLFGSVAHSVARYSPCPVVVVRAPKT